MVEQALTIELCGHLADRVGRSVELPLPGPEISVDAMLLALGDHHPPLREAIAGGRVRVCVNETIVSNDAPVKAGDIVALFPPVSGG